MFVIMDMEWILSYDRVPCPTQIAAVRVDRFWRQWGEFSSLIRPRDSSCHKWNHIAYSSGDKEAFLEARSARSVFRSLFQWLRDDDILLWWRDSSMHVFEDAVSHILDQSVFHRMRALATIVCGACHGKGNAYQLAWQRGIATPLPQHVSANDVEAIRMLLQFIRLRDTSVINPQNDTTYKPVVMKYLLDPKTKLLHVAEDGCLKESPYGFATIKGCLRKELKPCPICCKEIYRKESMDYTAEVISNTEYNYVFQDKSEVFHKADCVHARRMKYTEVKGSVYYYVCEELGKRPCRLCNPMPNYIRPANLLKPKLTPVTSKFPEKPKPKLIPGMTRQLNADELRAYKRHMEASKGRLAIVDDDVTDDVMTRSCSSYNFWAARGYRTFHLGDCPKLSGLTNLEGFSQFSQARAKGLTPCRFCRPSIKNDLRISVPSGGRIRPGETTAILDHLCDEYGYDHHMDGALYFIETPVGKWKLDTSGCPVDLWHINLTNQRSPDYHKQPRLLLSLSDTFWYIYRHDRQLLERQPAIDDMDDLLRQVDAELEYLDAI